MKVGEKLYGGEHELAIAGVLDATARMWTAPDEFRARTLWAWPGAQPREVRRDPSEPATPGTWFASGAAHFCANGSDSSAP